MTGVPERQDAPVRTGDGPVRVLWLIKGLGPGGAELLLAMMADVRDRDGFVYEAAYLLPWKDAVVKDLEGSGVPVHCLNGRREWNLGWGRRLRKLLKERHFDIVHVHSPYVAGVARLVARSLPRDVRPAMISTEHVPWPKYATATRILNGVTFRMDRRHVAVSRAVEDSIPPRLRGDLRVVHHGIPLEKVRRQLRHRDEVRAELDVAPGEVVVGTVSNFRSQKGYPDLLRAARLVLDEAPSIRFVAVGQGPLEQEIGALHRKLRLGDRFAILGYRPDAVRVMGGFDVFVLASTYEGLPVALMEAMALGLPVVATAAGGIPECVTDGIEGLLVPSERPDLLAGAIRRMAGDEDLRARLGRAAGRRGADFDVRGAARTIEAAYREVTA